MRKLLPLILLLIGTGAGIGAGVAMKPKASEETEAANCNPATTESDHPAAEATMPEESNGHQGGENNQEHDYVKLNNQFVIPVVKHEKVASLVVLSLSLEVEPGSNDEVFAKEPKLRDAFLQVLFDHANSGGFDGAFTRSNNMIILRNALLEVARKTLGAIVSDVLIVDIVRQDT